MKSADWVSALAIATALVWGGNALAQGRLDTQKTRGTPASRPDQPRSQDPLLPWSDMSNYQECGMACLYEKGNENLSLQAIHVLGKLRQLKDLNAKDDAKEMQSLMGAFCGSKSGNELDTCRNQYVRMNLTLLRRIGLAIKANTTSAAKFQNGGQFDMRNDLPVFAMLRDENADGRPKKPQTPTVPDLKSLQAQYKQETESLRRQISPDYDDWSKSLSGQPEQSDYVMTREIDRDPGSPQSGKITVVVTNRDGSPKIDHQKYQEARRRYEKQGLDRQKEIGTHGQYLKQNVSNDAYKSDMDDSIYDYNNSNVGSFREARKPVVEGANRAIKNAGLKSRSTVTFRGAGSAEKIAPNPAQGGKIPGARAPASPDADDPRVDEPMPLKDKTNFVTVVFPNDAIEKFAAEIEKDSRFSQ